MKKEEKLAVINSIKRKHTKTLTAMRSTLIHWGELHGKKKSSWFCDGDNGNRSQRKYKESFYNCNDALDLGIAHLEYVSDCSMSRKHVYWTDSLNCEIDGTSVNATFGDIGYFIDEIKSIIEGRAVD